jgi:hypothetical protein
MNQISEQKFLQALAICQSLVTVQKQPSHLPCEAINLFCDIAQQPDELLHLCQKYSEAIKPALEEVANYAASIDNWKYGDCPFGLKDHCNILHFFLNIHTKQFKFFRGENFTPEFICEFLKDWKSIDLTSLIEDKVRVLL